jgi:hypothetical protein
MHEAWSHGLKWFICGLVWAGIHLFPVTLYAQCNPGDYLLDEDDERYYCARGLSTAAFQEILADLENYLLKGPPPAELLGEQWRYRKAVVEAAAAFARKRNHPGMPYGFGGKQIIESGGKATYICVSRKKGEEHQCDDDRISIDCSGLVGYADRFASCIISGFYGAACGQLHILDTSAHDQYVAFKRNESFIAPNGVPQPGDTIFFKKQASDTRIEISHAAIYLGKGGDHRIRMLHASWRAGEVVFTKLSETDPLAQRIIGYGNISKLYDKSGPPR